MWGQSVVIEWVEGKSLEAEILEEPLMNGLHHKLLI